MKQHLIVAFFSTPRKFDEPSDTSLTLPELANFSNPRLLRLNSGGLDLAGLFDEHDKENSPVKKRAMAFAPRRLKRVHRAPAPQPQPKQSLSSEQQRIVTCVENGESVFFTGSAGTGKTVVLRHVVACLLRKHGALKVGVTALTGLAACNIQGQTLHKFLGIGLGTGSAGELAARIKRNALTKSRWLKLRVLIIDEISLIDGKLFSKINDVAQMLKGNALPFGGIQLVCTGDFYQLPPISRDGQAQFCFQSPAWRHAIRHTLTLTQVFRQQGDTELIDMLNALRKGALDAATAAKFRGLLRRVTYSDGIEPTELFPTRQEVKRANELRLALLPGARHVYAARDSHSDPMTKKLFENLMCEETLELKENAQVMYLKNHPDNLVVNGLMGTVVGFMSEGVFNSVCAMYGLHEFSNPSPEFLLVLRAVARREAGVADDTDLSAANVARVALIDYSGLEQLPLVHFHTGGGSSVILVRREEFSVDAGRTRSSPEEMPARTQIPLLLAWAMSIHKSQGQLIDRLRVDLRRIFEKGQVYVALSRATNKEHLEVLNFDVARISVAKEVTQFYEALGV